MTACRACALMASNSELGIGSVPIVPKPEAQFVFIGRDPSPRTAMRVGERGGRSVFIKEVFALADEAHVPEHKIYITNLCKCHWRTSRGTPLRDTETRPAALPTEYADCCVRTWLIKELQILTPHIVFSFGEELYQILKPFIVEPNPVPERFSATRDKSEPDAELYVATSGPLKIGMGSNVYTFIPLRHPGSSTSLVRSGSTDNRWKAHSKARRYAVTLLSAGCA